MRRAFLLLFMTACGGTSPVASNAAEDAGAGVAVLLDGGAVALAPVIDRLTERQPSGPLAVVPRDGGVLSQGPVAPPPLQIMFLGVGGFAIRAGEDLILSAPMFSNPSLGDVLGGSVAADPAVIDQFLTIPVEDTKAIITGHAHYDHLLDVPYVYSKTHGAMIYGNTSAARLLNALAPDRGPSCASSTTADPGETIIPPDRIVALDDPNNDRIDYRLCADSQSRCAGAWNGAAGEFISVPNSRVRLRALCSSHPDQFLVFHFGIGCVDEAQCTLPTRGSDWREGATIAYLIDFLDDSGNPIYRVYYQDAPTTAPVGHVHPDLLAEKAIDVALLCVGSYDQVGDFPGDFIRAMNPRYAIAGHWENFFKKQSEPLENIPFLDVDEFRARLEAEMRPTGEAPVLVNDVPTTDRQWMPDPGTTFEFRAQ